ncbi:MAG: Asp-tRNA(Asn)/Glu-tRNA(Gln) amidotransferase subunit GatB [Spirochaetes bacterium]|nr:Asp-tRNA(Asn)/Glu-tRNA(Gln) amidotransferase subunit GatB [Spirochaetota bacterium]
MEFEPVIGLEVHVQLNTETKIFCTCSTRFGSTPNTNVCPVCLGLPGVLPVLNQNVLKKAIQASLALNCHIASYSKFDRKHYYYPDLPKNYQISQYDLPIGYKGFLDIRNNDKTKRINITRVHMEEDAGKLIHSEKSSASFSYVDYNRTGVPLIEIVSEPDISSPAEAHRYLEVLKNRMRYIEVSDCNMEEGSLRCDANISIRPTGSKELGVKTEIKNMNSFKAVEKALEYEIKRQIEMLESKQKIKQETRLWDADKEVTTSMRSKEEAHDYRYFPEPDLVPIIVGPEWVKELKASLPQMPDEKFKQYIKKMGIPDENAYRLTAEKELALFFEKCAELYDNYKSLSNWIISEIVQYLNKHQKTIHDLKKLDPKSFVSLVKMVDKGEITSRVAKDVSTEVIEKGTDPEKIVKEKNLKQVSDVSAIDKMVDDVMAEEPDAVEKFKAGKEGVIGYLVGKVMQKSKGKANPKVVTELFRAKLK